MEVHSPPFGSSTLIHRNENDEQVVLATNDFFNGNDDRTFVLVLPQGTSTSSDDSMITCVSESTDCVDVRTF